MWSFLQAWKKKGLVQHHEDRPLVPDTKQVHTGLQGSMALKLASILAVEVLSMPIY